MKMFPKNNDSADSGAFYAEELPENQKNLPISKSLSDNLSILHNLFANCIDVTFRELNIEALDCSAVIIFTNGLLVQGL